MAKPPEQLAEEIDQLLCESVDTLTRAEVAAKFLMAAERTAEVREKLI